MLQKKWVSLVKVPEPVDDGVHVERVSIGSRYHHPDSVQFLPLLHPLPPPPPH